MVQQPEKDQVNRDDRAVTHYKGGLYRSRAENEGGVGETRRDVLNAQIRTRRLHADPRA